MPSRARPEYYLKKFPDLPQFFTLTDLERLTGRGRSQLSTRAKQGRLTPVALTMGGYLLFDERAVEEAKRSYQYGDEEEEMTYDTRHVPVVLNWYAFKAGKHATRPTRAFVVAAGHPVEVTNEPGQWRLHRPGYDPSTDLSLGYAEALYHEPSIPWLQHEVSAWLARFDQPATPQCLIDDTHAGAVEATSRPAGE